MTKDEHSEDTSNSRTIPKEVQDISTEEIIENEYDVPLMSKDGASKSEPKTGTKHLPAPSPPGRTVYDDSIEASTEDLGGDKTGYNFSAGHEMSSATTVGKPDDPHYDEKLQRMNDGRHRSEGTLSHRQSRWDKKRITQAICSDLPISRRQKEKVVHSMEQLDLDRFGHQKAIERVCLGTVAVIVNQERVDLAGDEDVTLISWEEEFQTLCDKYGVSMSDLTTVKDIVREELNNEPPEPSNTGIRRDPNLPEPDPAEKPDEYWQRKGSGYWVRLAKTWSFRDDNLKEAIPDEKQKIIDLLRRWKPWEQSEQQSNKEWDEDESIQAPETSPKVEPKPTELQDVTVEDEIEAAVVELVEELREGEE